MIEFGYLNNCNWVYIDYNQHDTCIVQVEILPDRFCFECSRECENVSAKLEMYNNVNGFIITILKVSCSLQRQSICSNGKPDCRNTFMQTLKQRARNYITYFMRLLVFPANS